MEKTSGDHITAFFPSFSSYRHSTNDLNDIFSEVSNLPLDLVYPSIRFPVTDGPNKIRTVE